MQLCYFFVIYRARTYGGWCYTQLLSSPWWQLALNEAAISVAESACCLVGVGWEEGKQHKAYPLCFLCRKWTCIIYSPRLLQYNFNAHWCYYQKSPEADLFSWELTTEVRTARRLQKGTAIFSPSVLWTYQWDKSDANHSEYQMELVPVSSVFELIIQRAIDFSLLCRFLVVRWWHAHVFLRFSQN